MTKHNRSGAAGIRQDSIFSLYFWILFLINLFVNAVTYMANTTMQSYSIIVLMTTVTMAGAIVSTANLGSLIFTFFCGPLGNHISKKTLVQLSSLLFAVSVVGYAAFENVHAVLFFRLLAGFGASINFTSGMVMVADVLPESRITEGVGYYGLASTLMQSFGPMLAFFIIDFWSYKANFIFAAVMAVTGFFLSFLLPDFPGDQKKNMAVTPANLIAEVFAKESWLPATIGFLFALINGMQQALVKSYADSLGIGGMAGAYFLVVSAMTIVSRIALGKFIQKKTVAFAAVFSGVFLITCPLLLGLGGTSLTMLAGGAMFGVGYGTLLPVTQSCAIKFAPPHKKSSGSSTYYLGITLAFVVSPIMGAFIADPQKLNLGYQQSFLVLTIPCVAAMLLALWKGRVPINPPSASA